MNEKIRQLAAAAVTAATTTKNKYFSSSRKGENFELKADLNSDRSGRKKDAVKRVIANMTIGKDVSALFTDVLKCMQTGDLELKKLVYLYLMNYAKSQPELAILAVNTFCKDTEDPNPLVRALALRTMGCIRVERIIDYLCEPLRKGLGDSNPYVRKTAAITVAKLHDLAPALAEENGFIAKLHDLISDMNPTVVANAIAALSEINEKKGRNQIFTVSSVNLSKLLASLNECTEWGQITILDAIAIYAPQSESEAEMVIDKTIPRLQHINPAVVLSAIRVLVVYMEKVPHHPALVASVTKKMIPPLVTLLTSHYEIQYVALRNIKLILQKYPELLKMELSIFFCKYNDPIYVKLEKLDLTVLLANEPNVDQILSELKEYVKEIDVEFSTKSVRAIGQTACCVPSCIGKAALILMDLVDTKVDHIVQECIVVIKDLLRKFGNLPQIDIPTLFAQLELISAPEAKLALIWILGEHCHLLENAPNLLAHFMEYFSEETVQVQYQVLTAAVKLYLRMPSIAHDAVHQLLQKATSLCDNADVRDKAFIYWRLLSCDPKFAKSIVLASKLPFEGTSSSYNAVTLQKLLFHVSTLSSVYHVPEDHMEKAPALPIQDLALDYPHDRSSSPRAFESLPDGTKIENILDLDLDFVFPSSSFSSAVLPSNRNVDLLSGDLDFALVEPSANLPTSAHAKGEPFAQRLRNSTVHSNTKAELHRNESPGDVLDLL